MGIDFICPSCQSPIEIIGKGGIEVHRCENCGIELGVMYISGWNDGYNTRLSPTGEEKNDEAREKDRRH